MFLPPVLSAGGMAWEPKFPGSKINQDVLRSQAIGPQNSLNRCLLLFGAAPPGTQVHHAEKYRRPTGTRDIDRIQLHDLCFMSANTSQTHRHKVGVNRDVTTDLFLLHRLQTETFELILIDQA